MLRIDQLYFRNFSILFFATLLITALSGYFLLEKIEIKNHHTMLENMIDQFMIIEDNESKIDEIVHQIRKETSVRVTIINASGVVLYESNRPIEGMENHLNRPEVAQALLKGKGSSIRYSQSVGKDFLYVVKRKNMRFVRMAFALDSIKEKFFKFWFKAIGLFAIAMLGAFWIAIKINQEISHDLEKINISLENLLNKKYKVNFDGIGCCREFETISKQIEKVSLKLKKRDAQKAKYTKNLKILSKKQGDIISAISHEFKNPIAAIMGYTQTVKEDPNLNPQTRDKFLDKVMKNSNKIVSMIDRLSLAIKLENDSFSPKITTFKLNPLVEDVKETLLQKYPNRKIILEIEDISIKADKSMFDNLMTNLLENALKYSEYEVKIKIKDSKVEVIDKGIGVEEEDIKNITKRFFRVDSLSWDNSIGVGLYIVKYILKLHGSTLQIESTPNIGSKFWFSIKKFEV